MKPHNLLSAHFRLQDSQKSALSKLGIKTIKDLLYHFPTRYTSLADIRVVQSIQDGEKVTLYGKVKNLKTVKSFRTRTARAEGTFEDDTGSLKVLWFHQPYIAKMIHPERFIKLEGKVTFKDGKGTLMNPNYEHLDSVPIAVGNSLFTENTTHDLLSYPIYQESKGITSKWFYHALQKIFASGTLETLSDPLPSEMLTRYHLPSLKTALIWIHTPRKDADSTAARKRFAFEEVFFIQLRKLKDRQSYDSEPTFPIILKDEDLTEFISRFPFAPTEAQTIAISDIRKDFASGHPMSRLLEGDVGSGKTFVAAATSYAAIMTPPKDNKYASLQVAYMAPTEILAKQLFESFCQYFNHLPISIGLLTGSGCLKFPSKIAPDKPTKLSRAQLLKWVKEGTVTILVGTHALIQKSVTFKNLAFVIIDEQHRFGINQRKNLTRKGGPLPHLLSMTATPIPRTLALTMYGDLDLTLLDQMPQGRKPIITDIISPDKREQTYEHIRSELEAGRQLYVICPRIDEPDLEKEQALLAKSVTEEARRLKKSVFKEYSIGVLHGKMKPHEKDEVMLKFERKDIDILVATSVVEVGINVPNATLIIIEGAERFGLSQLHQLRGRVIRGNHQAYCYIFTESKSTKTKERLDAIKKAKNGFELAEYDLSLRGAGELAGARQSGISDIGMEALRNIKMIEAARKEAKDIIEHDPTLREHASLREYIEHEIEYIHFE